MWMNLMFIFNLEMKFFISLVIPQYLKIKGMNSHQRGSNRPLTYAKTSNKQRKTLIDKVFANQDTIKAAAQSLGIKYSTAKRICSEFRKKQALQRQRIERKAKMDRKTFEQVIVKVEEPSYDQPEIIAHTEPVVQQAPSQILDNEPEEIITSHAAELSTISWWYAFFPFFFNWGHYYSLGGA